MSRDGRKPARRDSRPRVELLENRRLLTRPLPIPLVPPGVRNVVFDRAVYTIKVEGPGLVRVQAGGRGKVGIDVFGSTDSSVLSITRKRAGAHWEGTDLAVGRIDVKSGRLGAVHAASADLLGTLAIRSDRVESIRFDALGTQAILDVHGDLGSLEARSIDLGPGGLIHIGGRLDQLAVSGRLNLDGGQILIDQALTLGANLGALRVANNGRFATNGDLAPLRIVGDVQIASGGSVATPANLAGLEVGGNLTVADRGRFDVQVDVTGQVVVRSALRVGEGGAFTVGRDLRNGLMSGGDFRIDGGSVRIGRDILGSLAVGGSLNAGAGATMDVGRNVEAIDIVGNLDTSAGGVIRVGGTIGRLTVHGAIIGKGLPGVSDLIVGLDLNRLFVAGVVPAAGGITRFDLAVEKNLVGLEVHHGIFHSFVTAGVLIDGGPTPSGGHIGPDGPVAVFDSEIRAGVQIRNLLISGDVQSDQVTNPSGRPTRIIAGLDRAGEYHTGGNIDNFQITGSLIDAVIAASVAPQGGDGSLVLECSDDPGDGTYDAPAGTLAIGAIGNVVEVDHYAPGSYNEFGQLTGYFYDTTLDPTIDDCILPGAINASFAPTPLSAANPPAGGTQIPLPSKSTVLGGVINTLPRNGPADFAGIFAADTRGVFVGVLPY